MKNEKGDAYLFASPLNLVRMFASHFHDSSDAIFKNRLKTVLN